MVLDAVSNFVRGTADAEVGTEDTTVSVDDASIFPDPATDGEFNVVIWDVNNFPRPDQDGDVEIMRVTGRDTTADELTVTRGQEMTSAAAHPEGSAIHLSPTAKMFSDIESTFGDFWDAGTQELTADVNNTNTTTTALESDSIESDALGMHTARDDNELDTVLSEASDGDVIYLGNARFSDNRSISTSLAFLGTAYYGTSTGGSSIDGEWTFNARTRVVGVNVASNGVLEFNDRVYFSESYMGFVPLSIDADRCIINGVRNDQLTFESGTEDGIVDSCVQISVEDNGNNTVGDIG